MNAERATPAPGSGASEDDAGTEPIRGVYDFNRPGEPIGLYLGDGAVDDSGLGQVQIELSMRRGLQPRWESADPDHQVELDASVMSISHPDFGGVDVPIAVHRTDGRGDVQAVELGGAAQLARVVAHWVNLPPVLPSAPLKEPRRAWLGRWEAQVQGWNLVLDSRADLSDTLRSAFEDDEQFVMTHVAELKREHSEEFDSATAAHVLFGWQLAMSFALGRFVAPALPVGLDAQGRRVWEQWAPWRCDTLRGYEAWWDTHTGDDLTRFVEAYLGAYVDDERHDLVRWVAMHIITANHSGTTAEAKVMLAQAGLEYFGWVTLVLSGRMSRKGYKAMAAADRLRLLLTDAGIPTAVPPELDGLHAFATRDHRDGPEAAAWVRNRLVHPKDPGEPYRINTLVWQTAQLLLEYGELLLLHWLGYDGRYMRRYPPGRWAHSSAPVPWSNRELQAGDINTPHGTC
jgi:hypothetical protein